MRKRLKVDKNISDSLDGLRGFSALIVFFSHLNQIFNLPIVGLGGGWQLVPMILASYAVLFFLLLSGFWIVISTLNNIEDNGYFCWASYIKSRFLRIYPPLVFSLLLSATVYFVVTGFGLHGSESFKIDGDLYVARENVQLDIVNYLKTLLLLPGVYPHWTVVSLNGPLWSISYEWFAYLLMMFISIWVAGKNKSFLWGGFPLLVILVVEVCWGNSLFVFLIVVWCLGAALGFLYANGIQVHYRYIVPALIALVCCCSYFVFLDWRIIIPYGGWKSYVHEFFLMIAFVLCFSFRFLRGLLCNKLLVSASKFSYTLYVLHFPLLLMAFSFFHEFYTSSSSLVRLTILFVVSLVIVYLSSILSKVLENKAFWNGLVMNFIRKKLLRMYSNRSDT